MNTSDSPWPCAIHNPDNLEPSQFGDPTIWRPATPDETADVPHEWWNKLLSRWQPQKILAEPYSHLILTYRIRLADRPWPVAKPADFPPPPVGHEWHNPGGMPADKLPDGWRLLVKQEVDGNNHDGCLFWYEKGKKFGLGYPNGSIWKWDEESTILVPASTPFPPADLTDADPCPQEPPHGWVEVTSGLRQQHDWMIEPHGFAFWTTAPGIAVADFYQVHGEGSKIYRHPARMPKAEEKAEPELPGVEHHMRNSQPFDMQSRAEKAEAAYEEAVIQLGKKEAELAALKSRKIGVLLPIVEPLPPVPKGCERVTSYNYKGKWVITNHTLKPESHYADIPIPAAPDKRAEFEAMHRDKLAGDNWRRDADGSFSVYVIEAGFQYWLNAGGDK